MLGLTKHGKEKTVSGDNNRTDRPWGSFFILDDQKTAKVKRLVVNPGERLSYQSHTKRDEHWVIIAGIATVVLDDVERDFGYGEHVFVKRGTKHRICCRGNEPVELIEVQVGTSFEEEDITRYSDDYGREGTVD
ncbi:MAG: phosphomannose isomerase type II C-terminal cupin domain [Candidatus Obscuribacterales bacterium]|nr:phosphomannose isomerase type II C-terminal cupin domain [Candidatus Obscuribacterales bacterium]